MPKRKSAGPLLADPIKCRWCTYTIRRFERRDGSRIKSVWHLLLDHIYDVHPERAALLTEIPDSISADVFEWRGTDA